MIYCRDIMSECEGYLRTHPETRGNDNLLYLEFAKARHCEGYSLKSILTYMDNYQMPPFETVRRTRQKIQEQNPSLKAEKRLVDARKAKQWDFHQFALEDIENG